MKLGTQGRGGGLNVGAALRVLALLGAGIAGTVAVVQPAAAQDYTTGSITGTVIDPGGKPIAAAQVVLTSQAQGQSRTLTASGSGTFSAAGLTPGVYSVIVRASGYTDLDDTLTVVAAQDNAVTLTLSSVNASKDIVVTGTRVRQDFTKTTTGLTVNVPDLAKNAPVGRSITSLILLAPGTVAGNTGFGSVPSIGGSSVAENAYYINGLNITNPDTYVGSTRVPFDFYENVDVETGGYAAEFGRATGGVINATTKSGSNEPMMAIHGNFDPSLESSSPNLGPVDQPTTIGRLARDWNDSLTFEASGPIIKDHVFFYGLFEPQSIITERAYPSSQYYEKQKSQTPFYGGKADVYVTSTQHLEFTFFDTTEKNYVTDYAFTPNADFTGGAVGASEGTELLHTGGFNWVARYTGNITDFFQISGAYGINKDSDDVGPSDTASYFVNDRRTATVSGVSSTISAQTFLTADTDDTKRKFYRVDGDLRFGLLGEHHVRFGLDNEDLSEEKVDQIVGGLPIEYSYRNAGVLLTYERLGGFVSGRDRAFYLQDSWQPLRGLTLNLGVRDDEFNQKNLSGQQYLDFKGDWAARLGFSYTPNGTSPFRFFGNYGRYFIPPAMNLGFRGKDDYFQEYFSYPTGYTAATFPVDPQTGLPLINLGAARTGIPGLDTPCPNDISSAPGQPVNGDATCAVYGSNLQDPAYAKVAPDARATYEDEFILGTRFQPTGLLSFGLTGTYRRLARVSEDTDFAPYLYDHYGCGTAAQSGTAAQCDRYAIGNTYYIWNPGSSVTLVDWVDPTKQVTLTGLKFPKPKRTYTSVVFDFKRADDGVWSAAGSLTYARSRGNYEGTVSSDVGNSVQTDAGATIDYDYLGLTDYTYGILPNDHAFTFKLFGGYHFTHNLELGTNILVQSPGHGSCEGYDPNDPYAFGYGALSFYCAYGPLVADTSGGEGYTETQGSPRGTGWKTDWMTQIDLSARYTLPVSWGFTKGFTLRADVFNVFDAHAVTQRNSQHENDAETDPNNGVLYFYPDPTYELPNAYQTPRYVRFGFDLLF